MILSNDGFDAFHYRSYGTFFLQQNRLHNSYGGFTHYRNYRAFYCSLQRLFKDFNCIFFSLTCIMNKKVKIVL